MKILVTGGAGFIGSHLVDRLCGQGHEVAVLDNLSTGKIEHLPVQASLFRYDLTDERVRWCLQQFQPEIIYHLAAQTEVRVSLQKPVLDGQSNILGSINLLAAGAEAGVRKIIYASSAAVYGNPRSLPINEHHPVAPLSFYGVSKYVPEMYLQLFSQLYGLEYTVLRYANVYGPRQNSQGEGGVIAIFSARIAAGLQPVIFGDGEQTRDFIYVDDVVAANLAALERGNQQTINISSKTRTSLNELLQVYRQILQHEVSASYTGGRPGDIMHSCLDNQLAQNTLAWKPAYDLMQGITTTLTYFRNNPLAAQPTNH